MFGALDAQGGGSQNPIKDMWEIVRYCEHSDPVQATYAIAVLLQRWATGDREAEMLAMFEGVSDMAQCSTHTQFVMIAEILLPNSNFMKLYGNDRLRRQPSDQLAKMINNVVFEVDVRQMMETELSRSNEKVPWDMLFNQTYNLTGKLIKRLFEDIKTILEDRDKTDAVKKIEVAGKLFRLAMLRIIITDRKRRFENILKSPTFDSAMKKMGKQKSKN